jgi:hypothetical protein
MLDPNITICSFAVETIIQTPPISATVWVLIVSRPFLRCSCFGDLVHALLSFSGSLFHRYTIMYLVQQVYLASPSHHFYSCSFFHDFKFKKFTRMSTGGRTLCSVSLSCQFSMLLSMKPLAHTVPLRKYLTSSTFLHKILPKDNIF